MSDEKEQKTEMVTKEQFEAQQAELNKLKKIFEERQTKVNEQANKKIEQAELTKEQVLKVLGIEKDAERDPLELVNEKLQATNKTIEELQNQLKKKDEELEINSKKSNLINLAKELSFNDVNDVLAFVDVNSETLADDLKRLAETKPYLVKQVNVGDAFNNAKKQETTSSFDEVQKRIQKTLRR